MAEYRYYAKQIAVVHDDKIIVYDIERTINKAIAEKSTPRIEDIEGAIGDSTLNTTDKTLIGAINEVNAKAESIDLSGYVTNEEIGSLSNLSTADKTTIVNAINEVNSKAENIDLSEYATKEELNTVSDKYTGFGASYWEAFFKEGRTDYSYAFINNGAIEIKPTQVINASSISYILMNCSNLVDASPIVINLTSDKPNCLSICMGCVLMEKPPTINFTGENAHVIRSYVCAFTNCIHLKSAVIWLGDGTQSPSGERTDMANTFMNCGELQSLAFTGKGSPKNLDLSSCKKLTVESIETLETALMDVSEETAGTYEITISSETAALMPAELTAAFTAKGWTLNIEEEV